ncbi:unnamed protein product [Periconia digitata]|uniref:Uncharacterized protein n=1 Tax=Periconia digitata TaxID=1303443 RepID=A0A9W4U1R0_9PLEO|nr:unnamed protein product [Periconia digitata]
MDAGRHSESVVHSPLINRKRPARAINKAIAESTRYVSPTCRPFGPYELHGANRTCVIKPARKKSGEDGPRRAETGVGWALGAAVDQFRFLRGTCKPLPMLDADLELGISAHLAHLPHATCCK